MKCYTAPYEGDQAYIFFSYCHDDAAAVYPIIERLAIEGFRVWFDDGVHPGDDWPEVIAAHMKKASVCMAAISKASTESHNCRNELSFAVANNQPLISVIIEEFPMPLGMQLQLSSSNYIKKTEYEGEAFYQKLLKSKSIVKCRDKNVHASQEALREWQVHFVEYSQPEEPDSSVKDPTFVRTWFEKQKRIQTEIERLEKERQEAEERLRKEKEQLEREAQAKKRKAEHLRQEFLKIEKARREEEEARRREEEEARRKAEEEARRKAEEEARRKAEKEARRKAEEKARREAEEKACRDAEEEARRREAEEKARREAEEEARRREVEEKARREAEEKARREAEEKARREAEEEARRREEETVRLDTGENDPIEEEEATHIGDDDALRSLRKEKALLIRVRTGEQFSINRPLVRVGRSSQRSDIVIKGNESISRLHAAIKRFPDGYRLENRSAKQRTEVNGVMVANTESAPLDECTELRLANEQFFFLSGASCRRVIADKKLSMLRSRETGETKLLIDGVLPLNRYHKWRYNVLGSDRVSRERHAEIYRTDDGVCLRDVGSRHGTFCNGERVKPGDVMMLSDGDIISVAGTEFVYLESGIEE